MHDRKLLSRVSAVVFATLLAGTWGNLRAQEGHLDVMSIPSGAHVSVDGMEIRRVTPLRVDDVHVGMHTVKVYIPNSDWNPDIRTVNIVRGDNDLHVTLQYGTSGGGTGTQGPAGPMGAGARGTSRDPQGRQVQPVRKAPQGPKGDTDQQDLRQDPRAAPAGPQGWQDPWGHLVRPVLLAPWGQRDPQEPPAQQDLKGQQGQQEHKAQPAVSAP